MKYRDDEYDYEYEKRRREVEQRKRVRPDAQMNSQRRRASSGDTDSYAKRCAQSYEGSRRAGGQSYSTTRGTASRTAGTSGSRSMQGSRSVQGTRTTQGTRAPQGNRSVQGSRSMQGSRSVQGTRNPQAARNAQTRGAQTGARRPLGADPYDRRYSSSSYAYEDMSSRKRKRPAEEPVRSRGRADKPKAKKGKRRGRKILFAIEGILLVIVLAALFVISKWDLIQKASFGKKDVHVNELSSNTIESMSGYRTIAIFGKDENGTHSDVIMVANINNETKEITLTSVLRDTYWNVPDLSTGDTEKYAKANNAYHTGGDLGALNALNKNLDLSITEYVTVNWYAVAQVVDQLGGLDIDVPESMMGEINGYITNTVQETKSIATGLGKGSVQIKHSGLQTLDGIQTVAYCRIRHNNGGDDGRAQRQREVVGMILEKLKTQSIGRVLEICNIVFPEVSTNMSLADILALAPDVGEYSIAKTIAFPYHQLDALVGSASVKVPLGLAEDVTQLHQELFNDTAYTPSDTVQQISNKIEKLTGLGVEDRTN